MNILYLALDANCDGNFAESTHVLEVVRELRRRHRVILIAHSLPELRMQDDLEIAQILGIAGKVTPGIMLDIRLLSKLSSLIKRERIDVIYERRLSPKISSSLSLITSVSSFLEVNGDISKEAALLGRAEQTKSALNLMRSFVSRRLWRQLNGVVAVTNEIGTSVKEYYKLHDGNVHVITNGVNTSLFIPHPKQEAKMHLGLQPEAKVIGFSGQFFPWQGLDTLLDAFVHVRKNVGEVYLLMIGDGVLRDALYRQATSIGLQKHILWMGCKPYQQIPSLLSSCDVGVVLKKGLDSFSPLKLYEYLSLGLPVVATRMPCFRFVEEHRFGILVPEGNAASSANALTEILNNEEWRKRVYREARDYAVNNCSWERVAWELQEIFSGCREQARTVTQPEQIRS